MKLSIPETIILGSYRRHLESNHAGELLGGGFLKKQPGIDHQDYDPPSYSLSYLIQGRGTYTDYRNISTPLIPGAIFLRIPGYPHTTRITGEPPWWECFIDFGPKLIESLIAMRLIDPEQPVRFVGTNQNWVDAFNGMHHQLHEADTPAHGKILADMLDLHQRILAATNTAPDTPDQRMVNEAARILAGDFDRTPDIRQICRDRGWGYERFRKVFQADMGISPGKYRIRCRLAEARRLLQGRTDLSIGAITSTLGYTNPYEFSAQFKKHTGQSPLNYRRFG